MLDEGLEVRDVRRNIAQTLKGKGGEKGEAGPRTELARAVEKQLRDLQNAQQKSSRDSERWPNTAWSLRGCWPEQKETNNCPETVLRRSRSRHRNPQRVRQHACGHSLAVPDGHALAGEEVAPQARASACAASSVSHRGRAQRPRADSSCVETSEPRMRQP